MVEADGIETDEVVVPSELGLHATTARTAASAKPERIFTLPGYPGAWFGDIERSYDWVVPTTRRPIWVRPSLHTESEADVDRRVSWLELFFDLFFVVAIAQVSHGLADHPTTVGFIDFITRIVPVWFIWVGYTVYNERFESEGLENRLFTFLLMIPVIFLAVAGHDELATSFRTFVLAYAAAKLIITALWLRASWHVPRFRPVGLRYSAGFVVAIAVAIISTTLPFASGRWLFLIAVAIDIGTPWLTIGQQAQLPRFSTSKLPERYGLFVMIVLGETIVAVVGGLAEMAVIDFALGSNAVLAVAIGFLVWWLYYDFVGRRSPRRNARSSIFWGYLHLPLVIAIVSLGAGLRNLLTEASLEPSTRLLVTFGVSGVLLSIGLLELTLHRDDDEPTDRESPLLKLLIGVLVLGSVWVTITGPTTQLLLTFAALAVPALYGAWVWFFERVQVGGAERL